ncbi:MAG: Protease degQ, partial [uncultured bacterium]
NIVKNPNPTITTGIISAIHRTINIHEDDRIYGDLIQTDAAINQGNSGGPLVNLSGEVIGINTLIFSPSGGNVGIGFAIPINRGKMILDDLISGKEIQHGWLGIWLQDLDRDMVLQFGLTENQKGALVFKVEDDSPAQKAGLQSGDIIYDIDDHKINYSDDVSRIISGKKPGEKITMKIYRNGKSLVTEPVIAAREKTSSKAAAVKETLLEWRGLTIDETGDNTTNNLKPAKGVVVTNVKYGSSAYHAQISKGDIIYSIAHNEINSKEDFSEIVKKYKSKDVLLHTSRGYVVLYDEK